MILVSMKPNSRRGFVLSSGYAIVTYRVLARLGFDRVDVRIFASVFLHYFLPVFGIVYSIVVGWILDEEVFLDGRVVDTIIGYGMIQVLQVHADLVSPSGFR